MRGQRWVWAVVASGCDTAPIASITTTTPTETCTVAAVGSPSALDEVTSLGFSAQDVLDLLGGELAVNAVNAKDDSVEARVLTITVTGGAAQVEEHTAAVGAEGSCLSGTVLAIDGTLEVASADGWFSGSGPVRIAAQSADLAETWVDARFEVAPSTDLAAFAAESTGQDFEPSEVVVRYSASDAVSRPWAEEAGRLTYEYESCVGSDLSGDGTLYFLVPSGG